MSPADNLKIRRAVAMVAISMSVMLRYMPFRMMSCTPLAVAPEGKGSEEAIWPPRGILLRCAHDAMPAALRDISIALTAVSLGLLDGIAKDLPRRAE